MIGKFASVTVSVTATVHALVLLLVLIILMGAQGFAQTAPAAQAPETPAPAAQQPAAPTPAAQKPDTARNRRMRDLLRGGNAFTTTRTGTTTSAPAPILTAARLGPG